MPKLLIVANVSKEHIRKFHIPVIEKMKELGWEVDVACRLDEPVPECDNAFDLPCDRDPFKGGIFKSVKILKKILKENKYDAVLCNTVVGSIVGRMAASSLRKEGLKVIYLCHGMHFFPGASKSRWLLGYPTEKLLAGKTDVIITINSTDYKTAKKYLNIPVTEKIHGMGVNLSKFRNCVLSEEEKAEKRLALGLNADDFILSYVAEIIDNKNQMMLIKMFVLVLAKIQNAKLVLIGPEHDGGALRKYIEEKNLQDKVKLLGWRNDIPELLKLSDLYVASSKSEGLPINLIEAMACDLPVIAGRNRGHAEIIEHGKNGFIVEVNDHNDMAKYVLELYNDVSLRVSIIKKAQEDIKKYEKEATLKELTDIIIQGVK